MNNPFKALASYRDALRDEPKLRYFFLWTLIDDVGTAAATWATVAFNNDVIRTPQDMARIAVPYLAAQILGSVAGGPLADLAGEHDRARVSRWRYKLVVWRYFAMSLVGASLVVTMARNRVTLGFLIAYVIVQQLLGQLAGPAQSALLIDLLRVRRVQVRPDGTPERDETGAPLEIKLHLLTALAMVQQATTAASVIGLLAGGWLLNTVAGGRYWPLFAFDIATYLVFCMGAAASLHPERTPREFRLAQLFGEPTRGEITRDARAASGGSTAMRLVKTAASHVRESFASLLRFLVARENLPFASMLLLWWLAQFLGSLYDGRLILVQTLGMSLEGYRRVQIAQHLAQVVMYTVCVALGSRLRWLGALFAGAVALDALAIALAGVGTLGIQAHGHGPAASLALVAAALTMDTALTVVLATLTGLAKGSVSSPLLRGRIFAAAALVSMLFGLLAQTLYPSLATRFGQAGLMTGVGVAQCVLVMLSFALPRRGPAGLRIVTASSGDG